MACGVVFPLYSMKVNPTGGENTTLKSVECDISLSSLKENVLTTPTLCGLWIFIILDL